MSFFFLFILQITGLQATLQSLESGSNTQMPVTQGKVLIYTQQVETGRASVQMAENSKLFSVLNLEYLVNITLPKCRCLHVLI